MGTLAEYKCRDCGYTKMLHLGSGMAYPRVTDATKDALASGQYGPGLKEAFDSCELPAVAPEEKVYVCPSCGCWDVYGDASVYEPADIKAVSKERFGAKTVEEWGGIPYIDRRDIESGKYRLVRRYEPPCPACGRDMAPISGDQEDELDATLLKCPQCGSSNAAVDIVGDWD